MFENVVFLEKKCGVGVFCIIKLLFLVRLSDSVCQVLPVTRRSYFADSHTLQLPHTRLRENRSFISIDMTKDARSIAAASSARGDASLAPLASTCPLNGQIARGSDRLGFGQRYSII